MNIFGLKLVPRTMVLVLCINVTDLLSGLGVAGAIGKDMLWDILHSGTDGCLGFVHMDIHERMK